MKRTFEKRVRINGIKRRFLRIGMKEKNIESTVRKETTKNVTAKCQNRVKNKIVS